MLAHRPTLLCLLTLSTIKHSITLSSNTPLRSFASKNTSNYMYEWDLRIGSWNGTLEWDLGMRPQMFWQYCSRHNSWAQITSSTLFPPYRYPFWKQPASTGTTMDQCTQTPPTCIGTLCVLHLVLLCWWDTLTFCNHNIPLCSAKWIYTIPQLETTC